MKTLWKLAVTVFLLVLTLTCCGFIKKDMSTTVNKNGSVDISFTYLVHKDLADLSTGSDIDAINVKKDSPYRSVLEKRGYSVSDEKEGDYVGFTATRHYDSIKDISKNYEDAQGSDILIGQFFNEKKPYFNEEFPLFLVKKGTFKDTYSTYIGYEFSGNDLKELEVLNKDGNTVFNFNLHKDEVTFTYTVTVPNDSLIQEITPVNGSTASWSVPFGRPKGIDYSFTMYNRNFYLAVYGGIGLLVLLIAGGVVFFLLQRKKNARAAENDDVPAPQSPEEAAALLAFVSGETDTPPDVAKPQAPVMQPRPQPPVMQPRPQAPVMQPRPQAPVMQPRPQAPVAQPRPQAPVVQPRPQAPVAQPRPQAPVMQPQPQAPVAQPQPQAPVAQPQPQAPVAQPQPQAPVMQPQPQAPVAQPQPQAKGPTCPHCGAKLTVRVTGSGDVMMVCENYPATCKFTTSI